MENTLKVTNVLSDPTRFNIYQHIIKRRKPVTVLDVAEEFDIHPNVARLHLSKLEDIHLITSHFEKTGRGGRPSRLYELSDQVIELNFPYRDYKLLSSIALESLAELGDVGKEALYKTGREYGAGVVKRFKANVSIDEVSVEQKIQILDDAATMLGMYPTITYHEDKKQISFTVKNCPFKELVESNQKIICTMHQSFLKGMFEARFEEIELVETDNMFKGCENCEYIAKISVS